MFLGSTELLVKNPKALSVYLWLVLWMSVLSDQHCYYIISIITYSFLWSMV